MKQCRYTRDRGSVEFLVEFLTRQFDEAIAYARGLAPLGLRWFEEPCDPLDFALLAEIAGVYYAPLSTGK